MPLFPSGRAPALQQAGIALAGAWPTGARVGESAVCSLRVHLLTPADPDSVTVLIDRDAGQVFYGRRHGDQILHIDVFHSPGALPPGTIATAFARALAAYRGHFPGRGGTVSPDWFDVQTADGGGRLSGDLRGGRRDTVRAAHRGHVHLAGRVPSGEAAFCFYLVAAVESALAAAGLPPRKPLRVLRAAAGPSGPERAGLGDYAALTDTWLREERPPATGTQADPLGTPGEERLLSAAARLADEFGGAEAARALIEALARPARASSLRPAGWAPGRVRDGLNRLVQEGWVHPVGGEFQLTDRGQALRLCFARRLREVELALRSAARRPAPGQGKAPASGPLGPAGGRSRAARIQRHEAGQRIGEIAVSATAVAAATRSATAAVPLGVQPEDLRIRRRVRPRRVDMLLLIDASASMEGGRMRAAKTLARHLLLTGRDRVAVMAFQERSAVLAVPLTRNFAAADRGLRQVVPAGLTPLAAGLSAAHAYLRRAHAKNPLVLLVTDGIPTVSGSGGSPLDEALEEADRLKGSGIALCCVGLEPNERYLAELARRAGGRLQVVAELRPELLAAVARRERLRRMEG